jgi:hypothetical protein
VLLANKEYFLTKIELQPLPFVEEQTEEKCLELVKTNNHSIRYVIDQTEEMCLEAVRKYGRLLETCRVQSPRVCLAALKSDNYSIVLIINKEVRKFIVKILTEKTELDRLKAQSQELLKTIAEMEKS